MWRWCWMKACLSTRTPLTRGDWSSPFQWAEFGDVHFIWECIRWRRCTSYELIWQYETLYLDTIPVAWQPVTDTIVFIRGYIRDKHIKCWSQLTEWFMCAYWLNSRTSTPYLQALQLLEYFVLPDAGQPLLCVLQLLVPLAVSLDKETTGVSHPQNLSQHIAC